MNFRYNSIKEDVQQKLFVGKIENLTNTGIIKSESEYKKYLNSLLNNLKNHNVQLFNIKNIDIKYSDLIKFSSYKDNLELIYFDLFSAYKEMTKVKEILEVNLQKNKQFYNNLKERVRYYREYISLIKMNTYDTTISNKAFIESFYDYNRNYFLDNCVINEKTNKLSLSPIDIDEYNNSMDIDRVNVNIIPAENNDGGVYYTHTKKNDLYTNYKSGSRDMLRNGLWKLQILTHGVPENYINISDAQKKYYGITVLVDIYFTGTKPINRLFIDPYGEFYTKILSVQYLDGNEWKPIRKYNPTDGKFYHAEGEKIVFDFRNFNTVFTKAIRIVFNQPNYKTIDNYIFQTIDAYSSIIKEIEENRYESINKIKLLEKYLTKPNDNSNDEETILEKIFNIVLETNTFEDTEKQIKELLFPSLKTINYNSNWKVFELGAWKISPQYVKFSSEPGTFISHNNGGYNFSKSPLQVVLNVDDEIPQTTSIEYFITDEEESKFVPIIPINKKSRKEINKYEVFPSMYRNASTWDDNHIIKLDYPINENYKTFIKIYENGREKLLDTQFNEYIEFYNSRLFYPKNITYNDNNVYVVEYFPSKMEIVEAWILKPNNNIYDQVPHDYVNGTTKLKIYLDSYMIFPTETSASEFLYYFDRRNNTSLYSKGKLTMAKAYTPVKTYCRVDEYNLWFNDGVFPIFLDRGGYDLFTTQFDNVLNNYPYTLPRDDGWSEIRYNCKYTRGSWLLNTVLGNTYKPPSYGGDLSNWLDKYPCIII